MENPAPRERRGSLPYGPRSERRDSFSGSRGRKETRRQFFSRRLAGRRASEYGEAHLGFDIADLQTSINPLSQPAIDEIDSDTVKLTMFQQDNVVDDEEPQSPQNSGWKTKWVNPDIGDTDGA